MKERYRKENRSLELPIQTHLRSSQNLKSDEANNLLSRVAFQYHCAKYHFRPSKWTAEQTDGKLKEELANGPLLVFGELGPMVYKNPADKQEKTL